jgi:hypothetical protein
VDVVLERESEVADDIWMGREWVEADLGVESGVSFRGRGAFLLLSLGGGGGGDEGRELDACAVGADDGDGDDVDADVNADDGDDAPTSPARYYLAVSL